MDSGMRDLVASSSLSTSYRFHASSLGGLGDVKVLVVDHNRINQMLHHKLLDNLAIKNQVVGNGKEAVDIHVLGKQFDLILMDIDMPVMNGIEVTRKLRDMGIQSIITGGSSHTVGHVKQEFMAAGIDEYHEKPLTSAKLLSNPQQDQTQGLNFASPVIIIFPFFSSFLHFGFDFLVMKLTNSS